MYPRNLAVAPAPPAPPRLHWGWVLLLNVITRSLFEPIWLIVQANWVRRVRGKSRALPWCIAYLCAIPASIFMGACVGAVLAFRHLPFDQFAVTVITAGTVLLCIGVRIAAVFILRDELAEPPINIATGGAMTFFFGAVYFQYHLRDFHYDEAAFAATGSTLGLTT